MMSMQDFAGKIKQKYPVYNNLSDQELTQKMLAKYPQYKNQVTMTPVTSAVDTGIDSTIGKVPVAGGALSWLTKGITDPNTNYIDQVMQKTQQIQDVGKTNPQLGAQQASQYLSSASPSNLLKPGTIANQSISPAITDASVVATGLDLPELASAGVNAVKNIPKAASLLTKPGALKAQAVGASRGADVLISDIEKEALKLTGSKQPSEVMNEVGKVLSRLRGGNIDLTGQAKDIKPSLTTQDILDWRKQLDSELPKTFWEQLASGGNAAKNKAVGIVRTALTNTLHESAPGTKGPDKILGTMANVGGDIPSILKKLGVGLAVDRVSKAIGGPQAEAGADIFTVLKMLGKL